MVWVNVGYSRYFDTYLPYSLYGAFGNLGGLSRNVMDAIERSDCWLGITSLCVIISYICLGKGKERACPLFPFAVTFIFSMIFFIPYVKGVMKEQRRLREHFVELNDHRSVWNIMWNSFEGAKATSRKEAVFHHGLGVDGILEMSVDLERKEIPSELIPFVRKNAVPRYPLSHRNLIVILVESLSSYPIGKCWGGGRNNTCIEQDSVRGGVLF